MESIDAVAIVAAPGLGGLDVWNKLVEHCEICEDRFAILDCPADVESGETKGELDVKLLSYETIGNALPQRSKNAAFYFPYIEVIDPAKEMQDEDPARQVPFKYRGRVYVPPSGHLAGIYARTDEQRGVHKAPANAAVLGAVDLKYYVGKPKQELLNPQGVNCIRNMNGNITVWGARTIGGDKNAEWKYISVRRFFLFLRESIDEGTQWVVFEPNDNALWGKIRLNISAFLTNVWRSGALFGLTPEEAFYVKCDAETNPPEIRDLGMVVTEIGVAIVRPAEFVIFRITQSTGLSRT
jgi:phage tail sheath protein FI